MSSGFSTGFPDLSFTKYRFSSTVRAFEDSVTGPSGGVAEKGIRDSYSVDVGRAITSGAERSSGASPNHRGGAERGRMVRSSVFPRKSDRKALL